MADPSESGRPEFNPYDAPKEREIPLLNETSVARTVELLNQTRPWVRFFGGMGIAFTFLMTIGSVIGGLLLVSRGQASIKVLVFVVAYFISGLLYFFPSRHLWRYGGSIAAFSTNPTPENLNEALAQQKSFWKFIGVAMTVVLIFYVVLLVLGLLGVMFAALARTV